MRGVIRLQLGEHTTTDYIDLASCIEEDTTFDFLPVSCTRWTEANGSVHPIGTGGFCIHGRENTTHRSTSRVVLRKRLGFKVLFLHGEQSRRFSMVHNYSGLQVVGLQPSDSARSDTTAARDRTLGGSSAGGGSPGCLQRSRLTWPAMASHGLPRQALY